jgi:MFS transporter, ACS family, hexuronate transporter
LTSQTAPVEPPASRKLRNLRWYICGLLFLATVLNYVDRQVFSILAPDLQRDIGWSELSYGRIVIAFQLSYGLSLIVSGRLIDRIGTKVGYAVGVMWWSCAEMAHALASTPVGFGIARAALGIGEAANFPTAMKAISEWFPRAESGLATGILNSGPTVGAIAAPIFVPLVAAHWGWRGAFVVTGVFEAAWLVAWWRLYHKPEVHPLLEAGELSLIQAGRSTAPKEHVSYARLLGCSQTWAYVAGKVLADPAWYFYLFWLPKFLAQEHGLRGTAVIPYLATVYIFCGIGSALGGYLSSFLIQRGWTVNRARKTAMGVSALGMPIVIVAAQARDPWTAVLLIGLTVALHQSWSTQIFTVGTDLFPSRAMASATGLATALGSAATILFAEITGRVLQHNPSAYMPMFIACGLMYLVAWVVIHLLAPGLSPAKID